MNMKVLVLLCFVAFVYCEDDSCDIRQISKCPGFEPVDRMDEDVLMEMCNNLDDTFSCSERFIDRCKEQLLPEHLKIYEIGKQTAIALCRECDRASTATLMKKVEKCHPYMRVGMSNRSCQLNAENSRCLSILKMTKCYYDEMTSKCERAVSPVIYSYLIDESMEDLKKSACCASLFKDERDSNEKRRKRSIPIPFAFF